MKLLIEVVIAFVVLIHLILERNGEISVPMCLVGLMMQLVYIQFLRDYPNIICLKRLRLMIGWMGTLMIFTFMRELVISDT